VVKKRAVECRCRWEEGDPECPVHAPAGSPIALRPGETYEEFTIRVARERWQDGINRPVALRPDPMSTLGPAPRYFFILDDKPYETQGPSIPAINIRTRLPPEKCGYQLWLEVGPRNQCGNDRQLQDVDTIPTDPPYPPIYSIPAAHK